MPEFEIGSKLDSLSRRDIAIGNENHISNWTTRESNASDELAYKVNAAVLVCDGHDDADWDEENGTDSESHQQAIPGEMDGVAIFESVLYTGGKNGRRTHYSTTKMPMAVMDTNVIRYHIIGASLYLLISRL
jgi:hypothetical protein